MIITEDFVSFETAKLLREKGFEGKMHTFYTENGTEMESSYVVPSNFFPIYRPTLQMAMKYLREVHNIFIVIEPHVYDSINEKTSSYVASLWQGDNYYENIGSKDYPTHEEACDAVIKYCLENLI